MDEIRGDSNGMNAKEVSRMSDWFRNNGLTPEQFNSCLHYIANEAVVDETKEKPNSTPTKVKESD